jgi:hypothetical protein
MTIAVSAVIPLGVFVCLLWRYARLPPWQAAICAAFGYFLASSSIGPEIGNGLRALARLIAALDLLHESTSTGRRTQPLAGVGDAADE